MINGKNIILRSVREADLETMVELGNRVDQIGRFWPINLRSRAESLKNWKKDGLWGKEVGLLLICDFSGRMLGFVARIPYTEWSQGYEVGATIFKRADRGKGYMTEAVRLFTAYLFATEPIPRLQACVAVGNEGSKRVVEKCGFTYEGTGRKLMFVRGKLYDIQYYSLLRAECPSLKNVIKALKATAD